MSTENDSYEFDIDNIPTGQSPVEQDTAEQDLEYSSENQFDEMKANGLLSKEEVYLDILKNIKNDKIFLYYACIGTTYDKGKPIYDNQLLVDLLINYGYSITYVLYAIDKLASEPFYDNGESLLISLDRFRSEIYDDNSVKPLNSKVVRKILKQTMK